jgi:hypothetical protein
MGSYPVVSIFLLAFARMRPDENVVASAFTLLKIIKKFAFEIDLA